MRTQRWKTLRTRLGLGEVLNLISWEGSASFLDQSQSVVKQNQRNPGLPLIPALFSQPMKFKSTLLPVFSYTFSFALIGRCDCYDFSEKVEKRTNFACLIFFSQGRSRSNAPSAAGVLHALLTSKCTCPCTARTNRTNVANAKRCSLGLARWRSTFEHTQVLEGNFLSIFDAP